MSKKTNCPNCGAALKDGSCEYCRTQVNSETRGYLEITADYIRFGYIPKALTEDNQNENPYRSSFS